MGRFNWWRREGTRKPLQKKDAIYGKSFLLQQIEHGDFDTSDFRNQALKELQRCKVEQEKLKKTWPAGAGSLQYELDQIERKYIKRHNKLMEDYNSEEHRVLGRLREQIIKEFHVDVWSEVLDLNPNQTLLEFYRNYKIKANERLQNQAKIKKLELEAVISVPLQVAD